MEYNFKEIEAKWQSRWRTDKTYKVETDPSRPKFYVLDMFPYPSGAGLHVGHPLGYIASDIYSRYKRLKGFNVLHPMGYDAFGLPAEQYAIQTGQHPAVTTERNIARYREQLDKIGFSFDWDREVRTCDPAYYKWTQWAFLKMFGSYYCYDKQQARPIEELTAAFEQGGTQGLNVACSQELHFTAEEWRAMPEEELKQFAGEVVNRINNPYVDHALLAISLNSVSKWRARCMPSLLGYVEKTGKLPAHLTFSIAALMAFYTGTEIRDKALIGHRDGQEYNIMDDKAVLEFFAANCEKDTQTFVTSFLGNEDFFGQDLNKVPGLTDAVVAYLDDIKANGMRAALCKIS